MGELGVIASKQQQYDGAATSTSHCCSDPIFRLFAYTHLCDSSLQIFRFASLPQLQQANERIYTPYQFVRFFSVLFWRNWWTLFSRFVSVRCLLSSHITGLICFVIILLIAWIVCIFVWWTNRLLHSSHALSSLPLCLRTSQDMYKVQCSEIVEWVSACMRVRMSCHLQCKHICFS